MERLTDKHYGTADYYMKCSADPQCDGACGNCSKLEQLLNLLGAYEETGLTPGEIKLCTYTAQQITGIQNEAYDLGVQSVLYERFGLTWTDAEELQKEMAKVKAATTWIKAEERLPSKEEVAEHYAQYNEYPQYIVMIFGGKLPTILSYDGYIFYDDNTKEPYSISYWMPRPAPPEEEGTNE